MIDYGGGLIYYLGDMCARVGNIYRCIHFLERGGGGVFGAQIL